MPYQDSSARTNRLRVSCSKTAGELPAALRQGELAVNAADGRIFLPGMGGGLATFTTASSPSMVMQFPAAWSVAQASINSTIAASSSDTPQIVTMPRPTGVPTTARYSDHCRLLDGKIMVFWYDNSAQTTPVHPIVWDVEANTAELLPGDTLHTRKIFSPVALPNGTVFAPSYGSYSVKLITVATGDIVDLGFTPGGDWWHNGTYFAGSRYQVGITPDSGLGKARIFDSRNNTIKDVSSFTQPGGLRSGTMLPDGRSYLFRGAQGGGVFKACFYNPDSQTITYGANVGAWYECGAVMPDGKLLMPPYYNGTPTTLIQPKVYDPVTDTVSNPASFNVPGGSDFYSCYGCALLPDGNYFFGPGGANGGKRFIYSPTSGLVNTITDAALDRSYIPVWANGGWLVLAKGYADDIRPSALKAWTGEFDANLLNSSLLSKWA